VADISLKQGAALQLQIAALDDEGVAFDLSTVTARAQVRDVQDNLVATLPLTVGSAANLLLVALPSTSDWPIGLLRCDVRLTVAGMDVISDTFTIHMQPPVTR
jgi:hypothetical protein